MIVKGPLDALAPFPAFQSKALSEALLKHTPTFENYNQRLDRMTADIRVLEDYLRRNGIAASFALSLSQNPDVDLRKYVLAWRDHGKSGFRLMVHDGSQGPEFRPLLEAPLSARVALFPILPIFVTELANYINEHSSFERTLVYGSAAQLLGY